MKMYHVIKENKSYGYIFGEDVNHAVSMAKMSIGYWVKHEHLTQIKYRR